MLRRSLLLAAAWLMLACGVFAQNWNGIPNQSWDSSHLNGVPNQSVVPPSVNGVGNQALGLGPVATVVASPAAGTYSSAQTVSLTTGTPGATICYAVNATPAATSGTCTSGTTYSSAIAVSSSETINAIASKSGYTNSGVLSAAYTISATQAATPTASPVAGAYSSAQTVTLTTATSGAAIIYTTDGSVPTATNGVPGNGTLYSGPITVSSTQTINALASESGYTNSNVLSATYTIGTGAIINIGPGQTYANIGDAPWSTMANPTTVQITPKTPVAYTTSGSATAPTFVATLTSGSATMTYTSGDEPWVGEGISGTGIPSASYVTAVSGTTVTLGNLNNYTATVSGSETITGYGTKLTLTTSAASIAYGSALYYGTAWCSATNQASTCAKPVIVTCGLQGSGLYGTVQGGQVCAGSTILVQGAPISPASGSTVYIMAPYSEKIILTQPGITVEGLQDATTGLYPILDPTYATTGPNMAHAGSTAYHDAYAGIMLTDWDATNSIMPIGDMVENLVFSDTHHGVTIYDETNTAYINIGGYGIRFDNWGNSTFQGNTLIFNDDGVFGADNPGNAQADVVYHDAFLSNYYYWNGLQSGDHQSYFESIVPFGMNEYGSLYEFNWFDRSQPWSHNSQIKDRSAGEVVAYNRIVSNSGYSLDMVAAQNSFYDDMRMIGITVPASGLASGSTTITPTSGTFVCSTTAGSNLLQGSSPMPAVFSSPQYAFGMGILATGFPLGAINTGYPGVATLRMNTSATSTNSSETCTYNSVQGINVGDWVLYANLFDKLPITSVTAGNPTVLTMSSSSYPGKTVVGNQVNITGATGTGCSGLNGNQTITAISGATLTVSYDSTGCAYTASSALVHSGWGYPGSGLLQGPQVTAVNTSTNTITLSSGVPLGLAANQELFVISNQTNPYKQDFVYGNVFDGSQGKWPIPNPPSPIHCCRDEGSGTDAQGDRAATVQFYDNSVLVQRDQSSTYDVSGFTLESDEDAISANNNYWYVGPYTPGATPTYLILLHTGGYTGTGLVSTTFTSGNNQVTSSTGYTGSGPFCGYTWTGAQACGAPLDPGASVSLPTTAIESPVSMFPTGVVVYPYKLQTGSTAIGAASALPAAVTSNTLGGDFTPYYQPDGTARTALNDLGAWQASVFGPPPPATAVTLADIQSQPISNWTTQGGICCGTVSTGTDSTTFNNASPSFSGNSIDLVSSGAGYNVQAFYEAPLASLPGGTATGFTTIQASAYTYVPSTSPALQGIEGPDVVIYQGTYELYPSLQCATNAGSNTPTVATWNLYSMQNSWVSTNISCATYFASRNTWHHIQISYLLNFTGGGTMNYGMLVVDGVQIFNNLTGFSSTGRSFTGAQHVRPQYQLDTKTGAGTSDFYVDRYTLTFF